jgi:nucleoside-diphosphate-sugar epimerase
MKHLITGATGFIGSALAVELLGSDPDCGVVCLSRAKSGQSARERTIAALRTAARLYQRSVPDLTARVSVLEGDFDTLPELVAPVDVAWHTAASLKYLDRDRAEIKAVNVDAVARLVDWLSYHGVPQLNHFSTAYVFGQREGDCDEAGDFSQYEPNNVYEATKRDGELLVRNGDLQWRIMRPSIVIGHSQTYEGTSDTGVYGFLKNMLIFKDRVAKIFGDLYSNVSMHLLTVPSAPLDLIPVDRCVRAAVHAGEHVDPYSVVHITNSCGPTIGDALISGFEICGMVQPTFVSQAGLLSEMDFKFSEQIEFYAPYIRQEKRFLQADGEIAKISNIAIDRGELSQMLARYISARGRRSRSAFDDTVRKNHV